VLKKKAGRRPTQWKVNVGCELENLASRTVACQAPLPQEGGKEGKKSKKWESGRKPLSFCLTQICLNHPELPQRGFEALDDAGGDDFRRGQICAVLKGGVLQPENAGARLVARDEFVAGKAPEAFGFLAPVAAENGSGILPLPRSFLSKSGGGTPLPPPACQSGTAQNRREFQWDFLAREMPVRARAVNPGRLHPRRA
jgi:hypothetical protein